MTEKGVYWMNNLGVNIFLFSNFNFNFFGSNPYIKVLEVSFATFLKLFLRVGGIYFGKHPQ